MYLHVATIGKVGASAYTDFVLALTQRVSWIIADRELRHLEEHCARDLDDVGGDLANKMDALVAPHIVQTVRLLDGLSTEHDELQ